MSEPEGACPTCSALVADLDKHMAWHTGQSEDATKAAQAAASTADHDIVTGLE